MRSRSSSQKKMAPVGRIALRWEPEIEFRMPLHRCAPLARRAPEFLVEPFFRWEEEAWRMAAPLR